MLGPNVRQNRKHTVYVQWMFSKTYCGVAYNQPVWYCQVVYLLALTNSVIGWVVRTVNEITSTHESPDFYSKGWSLESFGNWLTTISIFVVRPLYVGGPKNNRNLNVARELEVVARCAARCRESTQYPNSLPRGVNPCRLFLLLWLFF